jgi:toxin HigB-1
MIRSFRDKEAEQLFHIKRSRKLPKNLHERAINKLWVLDAATDINDLRSPPANHLEKLQGNRAGQYSIRINAKWRICFEWSQNNAYNVEITDYHA